jgi:TPR repeat protein
VKQDLAQSAYWYRRAAEHGYPDGELALGVAYFDGAGLPKDHAEAVLWYRKAAEANNPVAQYLLALALVQGDGIAKNDSEAASWFRKAADQGEVESQGFLGLLYEYGRGVPQDRQLAAEWYRKAAERGNVLSQLALGRAYLNGDGVPQDRSEAVKWLTQAADRGNADAKGLLTTLSTQNTPPTPSGDKKSAEHDSWPSAKLVSFGTQHWTSSSGGATTTGHVDDQGNYSATTTPDVEWGHNTYQVVLDDGKMLYFAERTLSFRWQHDPHFTENSRVKFRIDRDNLTVVDDVGREFKMAITKRRIKE